MAKRTTPYSENPFNDPIDNMREFVDELMANRHVFVDVAIYRSPGRYTLRVRTPLRTHFREDSEEGWRAQVRQDIDLKGKVICPHCCTMADMQSSYRSKVCGGCGAETDQSPEALVDWLSPGTYSAAQVAWILEHFDKLVRVDSVLGWAWARFPDLIPEANGISEGHVLKSIAGPVQVPVILDTANLAEPTLRVVQQAKSNAALRVALRSCEAHFTPPSCRQCRHVVEVGEADGSEHYRCTYPSNGRVLQTKLAEKLGANKLRFSPEWLGGKQQPKAVIWNTFLSRFLDPLTPVDADPQALRVELGAPYSRLVGPICPAFLMDEKPAGSCTVLDMTVEGIAAGEPKPDN